MHRQQPLSPSRQPQASRAMPQPHKATCRSRLPPSRASRSAAKQPTRRRRCSLQHRRATPPKHESSRGAGLQIEPCSPAAYSPLKSLQLFTACYPGKYGGCAALLCLDYIDARTKEALDSPFAASESQNEMRSAQHVGLLLSLDGGHLKLQTADCTSPTFVLHSLS